MYGAENGVSDSERRRGVGSGWGCWREGGGGERGRRVWRVGGGEEEGVRADCVGGG